ncbi:MAG: cysteine synthase A [Candidatus Aminicenantes bacterium]|nr:MAG: cysteine synthase A [Candidatus Aminicenantes bacterium]
MKIHDSVLTLIGNTPLVRLKRIKKDIQATILAKLEYYNPSGSVKDRIALFMIEEAERQGKIKKGDCIVEPTSGNTGTSLALVCALKGYRMIAVMPEQMSQERKDMMTAFGAELVLVPSQGDAEPGTFTKADVETTLAKAEELASKPDHFMPNQFSNPANTLAHQQTTAEEIWDATDGHVDAFVAGVGTSGTAMGVSLGLKKKNPKAIIYVVEPAESAVIAGECPGYHRIQGIGEGFVPDLLEHEYYDEIIKVTDVEAKATACRLARLEGIFAGYSAGANVFASLKVARKLGGEKTVVTVIPDSGMKYLSTELFHHSPDICTIHCCTLEKPEMREECQKGAARCCVLEPCD